MKTTLLGILLLLSLTAQSATYYFSSSSGLDTYTAEQAKNQATPWKSIGKLNAIMSLLQPGDQVLFKRGDVFSGTILLKASGTVENPITLGAYGTDQAKPVLDSRLKLINWTNLGGNIWEASSSLLTSQPTALMINESLQPLGRYPNLDAENGGYLKVSSHPAGSKKVFSDNTFSGTINWTGAEAVIRTQRWSLERKLIANHTGTTFTFGSDANYEIADNYGYFLQNHPAALDKEGEWCYTDNKIRIFTTADPNTRNISVANTDKYIDINAQQYLVIDGFSFRGAKSNAISATQVQYLTIQNCVFWASGVNAITVIPGSKNGEGNAILNNVFSHTQTNAIIASGNQMMIKGNVLKQTGSVPGMAQSGQMGIAISTDGGATIERNIIDSTGYSSIRFFGSNVLIQENVINHFCLVIDDGGGIYTWSDGKSEPSNRKILNNLILNGWGAPNGSGNAAGTPPAEGIYLDDRTPNVEVIGNTIAYCSNKGIYLHNSRKCIVKNNTIFGCYTALGIIHDNNAPAFPVTECDIQNNLLVASTIDPQRTLLIFQTRDTSSLSKLGVLNNNIYCQPFLTDGFIKYKYVPSNTQVALATNLSIWQKMSGYDMDTRLSPRRFSLSGEFLSANLIENSSFSTNTSGWSSWDPRGNTSTMTWANNQLDGGSISFSVKGNNLPSSRLQTLLPSKTTKGKNYMLSLSTKGTQREAITAYLIQNIAPYPIGSNYYTVNVDTFRQNTEVLMEAIVSLSIPSLFIDVEAKDGTVYFDNIELHEVTPTNPDNHVRFEYNASASTKTFVADKHYLTPRGELYPKGSSIGIPAFGSVVLLVTDLTTGIKKFQKRALLPIPILYPNPLHQEALSIVLQGYDPQEEVLVAIYDLTGRQVYQKTWNVGNAPEVTLSVEDQVFSKGIYFVRISTPHGSDKVAKLLVH